MINKLNEIKDYLDVRIGKKIHLKANGGRNKMIERDGLLLETYRSVFVLQLERDGCTFERVSYSYADVLTETVKLTFDETVENTA